MAGSGPQYNPYMPFGEPPYSPYTSFGMSNQTTSSTGGLEKKFAKMSLEAKESNIKRQKKIEAIFDEIIARYKPGGTFGKSYLQQLGEQKVRDVGAGTQNLISSGMYGTTTTAGLPGKWEAEVGAPARLKLEDIQMERLSSAQLGKASFLERIEEPYPDYNALMQASAAAGSSGGGGGGYTISGSVALPGTYNPATDPTRHTQNVSGSSSGGGATTSPSTTTPGTTPHETSTIPYTPTGKSDAAPYGKTMYREGNFMMIPFWREADGDIHFADGRKPVTPTGISRTEGVLKEPIDSWLRRTGFAGGGTLYLAGGKGQISGA